jgi:gamma-glutamylcyclotransferase (GGCT)/AIG2-like uncharacterized protein YtfP
MPLLFSYGTLQQDDVQRSTFGRPLQGTKDELVGFARSSVPIEDAQVAAAGGQTHYASVVFNSRAESRVGGTLFEITDADLAAADRYEQPADYRRVSLMLASEKPAWVYVHAGFASSVYETLSRLGADSEKAVYLKPGASEAAIDTLQREARKDLGEEVPESFVRLLRLTNGAQINGAFFKEAENLVLENLDVPRPNVIVLGNAGNVDWYVFDKRDRRFHVTNFGFEDERLYSFHTFEELLLSVFRDEQQIE